MLSLPPLFAMISIRGIGALRLHFCRRRRRRCHLLCSVLLPSSSLLPPPLHFHMAPIWLPKAISAAYCLAAGHESGCILPGSVCTNFGYFGISACFRALLTQYDCNGPIWGRMFAAISAEISGRATSSTVKKKLLARFATEHFHAK